MKPTFEKVMDMCEKNLGNFLVCDGDAIVYLNKNNKILNVYLRESGEDITEDYLKKLKK